MKEIIKMEETKREREREKEIKKRASGVEEGGRFQSGYISAYILPSLPRYLRVEPAGLADITTRGCILLLMASGMLVNFPHVKRSTVRSFTDTVGCLNYRRDTILHSRAYLHRG